MVSQLGKNTFVTRKKHNKYVFVCLFFLKYQKISLHPLSPLWPFWLYSHWQVDLFFSVNEPIEIRLNLCKQTVVVGNTHTHTHTHTHTQKVSSPSIDLSGFQKDTVFSSLACSLLGSAQLFMKAQWGMLLSEFLHILESCLCLREAVLYRGYWWCYFF